MQPQIQQMFCFHWITAAYAGRPFVSILQMTQVIYFFDKYNGHERKIMTIFWGNKSILGLCRKGASDMYLGNQDAMKYTCAARISKFTATLSHNNWGRNCIITGFHNYIGIHMYNSISFKYQCIEIDFFFFLDTFSTQKQELVRFITEENSAKQEENFQMKDTQFVRQKTLMVRNKYFWKPVPLYVQQSNYISVAVIGNTAAVPYNMNCINFCQWILNRVTFHYSMKQLLQIVIWLPSSVVLYIVQQQNLVT